jgi:hypothetical protein
MEFREEQEAFPSATWERGEIGSAEGNDGITKFSKLTEFLRGGDGAD